LYRPGAGGQAVADVEDKEDIKSINNDLARALRGGGYASQAVGLRCADRTGYPVTYGMHHVGFRPARTCR
jgi:formylglycine-generating enzyme required for sulfatase activity